MAEKIQTLGKLLVRDALPEELKDFDMTLNGKGVNELFSTLATKYPDKYIDTLEKLTQLSSDVSTDYGRVASVRLSDLRLPPELAAYREDLRKKVSAVTQNPNLTPEDKNKKLVDLMRSYVMEIPDKMVDGTYKTSSFGLSVKEGFRGNKTQLTQLLFGDMLVADHKGRAIPVAGLHGYGEGTTPVEYWVGSYGARKGGMDTQFATAATGYFSKQLSRMAARGRVMDYDCGAKGVGVIRSGDDPEVIGSVLAAPIGTLKAGTFIDKQNFKQISGKKILVRSPLTCQLHDGICQLDAGRRDGGKLPEIGDYIGKDSARLVGEPVTQAGLSSKHLGGVVGTNDKNMEGFAEINQFMQVPERFIGSAALAPEDGAISQIVKAPQGGHYIHVNGKQVYAPQERILTVKVGDKVEAGDALSDGTPNPRDLAMYKGVGEGRRYFTEKLYELLKKNGAKSYRRNVEPLAKAFFERIKITSPDGVGDFEVGEVIPYSYLQSEYIPRHGSENTKVGRSTNRFLEKPVLHYTIGTRVTPKVIKELEDMGVSEVLTHPEPPGFEPEVVRMADYTSADMDWKTKLSGSNLKRNLLQSAAVGAVSPHKTTSPVPELMNPRLAKR